MIYYDFPITQGAFSTSKTLELPEGAVMALSQLQVSSSHPLLWNDHPIYNHKNKWHFGL